MNLNPFKKRNTEAEQQKRAEVWLAQEARVQSFIDKADALKDPAEKIIELRAVRAALGVVIRRQQDAIREEANQKGEKAGMVAMLPLGVAGMAAFTIITGPLAVAGLGALMGSVILGQTVKEKREGSVRRKLELSAADHLRNLRDKAASVSGMMEKAVTEHVQEIAKSPLHAEVMKDVHLAMIFAEAAAKQLVVQEEEVEALKKAQEKAKAEARPDIKKDYKKLADVMKPAEEKKPRAKKGGPKQNGLGPDGQ